MESVASENQKETLICKNIRKANVICESWFRLTSTMIVRANADASSTVIKRFPPSNFAEGPIRCDVFSRFLLHSLPIPHALITIFIVISGNHGVVAPSSSFILVFGAMLQNASEFDVIEITILVDGGPTEKFINLVLGESVSHRH